MRLVSCGLGFVAACACAPTPTPCASPGTCPEGTECLANRCVPNGGEPVGPTTRREVFEPKAMAVLHAEAAASGELPPAIVLGSRASGSAAVYLAYGPLPYAPEQIESAFLVLEPIGVGARDGLDVQARVWRVLDDWSPQSLSWLSQPDVGPPSAAAIARASPPQPLRIDVTRLVRYLAEPGRVDRGLALKASAGAGHGARYATGAVGGRPPRLEIYLR